jgi:hypothetical protein
VLSGLNAEMAVQHVGLMAHNLSGHAVHDVAVIEDVHPIGKRHCGGDVLFNQQDRLAGVRKGSAGGKKVMNDDRSETLERLVQQQHFRLPYERARDRQQLLFAAGKIGAAACPALLETRKHRVYPFQRPTVRRCQSCEDKILFDIEAAEDSAFLMDE